MRKKDKTTTKTIENLKIFLWNNNTRLCCIWWNECCMYIVQGTHKKWRKTHRQFYIYRITYIENWIIGKTKIVLHSRFSHCHVCMYVCVLCIKVDYLPFWNGIKIQQNTDFCLFFYSNFTPLCYSTKFRESDKEKFDCNALLKSFSVSVYLFFFFVHRSLDKRCCLYIYINIC